MDFGVRMLDRKDLNWCTPFFSVSQWIGGAWVKRADFGKNRNKDRNFCIREFGKIGLKVGVGGCFEVYLQSCKDSEFTKTFDAIPMNSTSYTCFFFRLTSYVDQMSAWYDVKTKLEVINIKVFEKLEVCYTIFCSKLIGPSNSSLIATFGSIHR